jgi:hypothetical protein
MLQSIEMHPLEHNRKRGHPSDLSVLAAGKTCPLSAYTPRGTACGLAREGSATPETPELSLVGPVCSSATGKNPVTASDL